MNKNVLLFLLPVMLISGCSLYKAQNCGENAGYQKGFNDAKAGRMMNMNNFSAMCDKESAASAQKGYREGFKAGADKGGAQLNLGFKDGKITLTGAYKCEVEFSGEKFSADASTEDKARAETLSKCRAKYPACPDTSVSCSK